MIVAAIVGAEIGFWVLLFAGLLVRYALRRPRLGGWLLVGVPLVDLVLLVLTVVDLRAGSEPHAAHGLAAVYLGMSVAFGHQLVRAADVRVAHRLAGGPAPAPRPAGGTSERVLAEWRDFGRALLAGTISAVLLLAAAWLAGPDAETGPLLGILPTIGLVLGVWLLAGPVVETARRWLAPVPRPVAVGSTEGSTSR